MRRQENPAIACHVNSTLHDTRATGGGVHPQGLVQAPSAGCPSVTSAKPDQWDESVVAEMSLLVLRIQDDAKKIIQETGHLAESRRYPRDCLRHAETLETWATILRTHSQQLVRRALESQS